jgi:hypothetical protein
MGYISKTDCLPCYQVQWQTEMCSIMYFTVLLNNAWAYVKGDHLPLNCSLYSRHMLFCVSMTWCLMVNTQKHTCLLFTLPTTTQRPITNTLMSTKEHIFAIKYIPEAFKPRPTRMISSLGPQELFYQLSRKWKFRSTLITLIRGATALTSLGRLTEQPPLAVFPDCTRRYWVGMWSAQRIPQLHFQLSKPDRYFFIQVTTQFIRSVDSVPDPTPSEKS